MGLTYYPKSKDVSEFDVNVAGADLLGQVHKIVGASLCDARFDQEIPRVHYVNDRETCLKDASILRDAIENKREALAALATPENYWDGTSDEFIEWIDSWQEFNEHCGGYDTDG
jgi:hypothetical protein